MNSELIEKVYSRINAYKSKIKELSYDEVCRKTNSAQIECLQGKIKELKWIARELAEQEDAE